MKTVGDIITEVALKRRAAKGVKTTSCSEDQIECAGCQANFRLNVRDVKQTCQCEATPWNWARCRNSPCTLFSCRSGALCQIIFIKDRASWCSHMQALQLIHLKDIEALFRLILTGSNLSFLFLQALHQIVAFFVGTFQIWRVYLVWVQLWLLWLTHFNFIFFPGV